MKKSFQKSHLFGAAAALLFLSGCETQLGAAVSAVTGKPAATTPAKPVAGAQNAVPAPAPAPQLSPEQLALKEGIDLYNKGDFNDAIKRLGSSDIANGSRAGQLSALKYTAFSYCVTNRATLCRQSFEKAFKLDPAFDLAPGEHGHPLWGKAFLRAKGPAPSAKK
ncbi:MAG: TssQ family T6SS-associated lipoprotein [Pseudomonadota bacterium]